MPLSFCWDNDDARLLVCETRCTIQQQQRKRPPTSMSTMKIPTQDQNKLISSANTTFDLNNFAETQAVLMFISNDKCELKEMETINLVSAEQLVDLCTPFLVIVTFSFPLHYSLQSSPIFFIDNFEIRTNRTTCIKQFQRN